VAVTLKNQYRRK